MVMRLGENKMEVYAYLLFGLLAMIGIVMGYSLGRVCSEEVKEYKKNIKILKIVVFLFTIVASAVYLINRDVELLMGSAVVLFFLIGIR